MKTLVDNASPATPPGLSDPPEFLDHADRASLLHERAVLSARLARLLSRSLRGLDWAGLPEADRLGLESALSGLGGDIPLLWLIRSQAAFDGGMTVFECGMTVSNANEVRNEEVSNEEVRNGGAAKERGTAKAAPAASPSREGSESSDGEAALYD